MRHDQSSLIFQQSNEKETMESPHNLNQPSSQTSDWEADSSDDDNSIAAPLVSNKPSKQANKKNSRARSNQAGIDTLLQKELAEDIEILFGGLQAFKKDQFGTAKLCSRKPDIYGGDTKSKRRQQVRDKLKQWKKLSAREYNSLLKDLGLLVNVGHSSTISTTKPVKTQETNIFPPQSTPANTRSTSAAPKISSSENPSIATKQETMNNKIQPITVDITRPENNREVYVFPVKELGGTKQSPSDADTDIDYYEGYIIAFPMDIRYYLDNEAVEYYSGRVFTSDSLMLRFPAFDYSLLHDRDPVNAPFAASVQDDLDDARHTYDQESQAREWKHLSLQFPSDHSLSSKVIHDGAGEDEELEFAIVPVQTTHPKLPTPIQNYCGVFKVARTDVKARKKGKVQKKDLKSKGATLLAGLATGTKAENPIKQDANKSSKSSKSGEPVPDNATSEEWLNAELVKAVHVTRVRKAEEHLMKLYDTGERDSEWIQKHLDDLDKFVADNSALLDELLANEEMDVDGASDDRKKRSFEGMH